jgi:alpha-L-fucosidase
LAKAAGMKYLVFTSKHHDGFCEFDSQLTDYKITHSPFKRDVVAELAQTCHEAGLKLGFYYSPPDWHHPDYRTDNHQRYIQYLHGQIRELCTRYGKLDILWFDGLGGSAKDWDAENLFKMLRELQPHILINNRAGLSADWDTPEQEIGKFQNHRAWETCMTLCNQWAWKPKDEMKSLKQCLQTLVRCAGGDGNLLFNVGPMPTGQIEPRQDKRLREMGEWLAKYGESIYATRGGPFKPGAWGASTHKANTIYLHAFNWLGDRLVLPPIDKKIVRSAIITGGQVDAAQNPEDITVTVAPADRQDIDTIIALELDGLASQITPCTVPSGSLTFHQLARASNVHQRQSQHAADQALDDDESTRWATDAGIKQAWLEVDLGRTRTFASVSIREAFPGRVQKFELQYQDGDSWRTCLNGATIGADYYQQFAPVTARIVRLNILEATDGPTLWEFQLFPASQPPNR